MNNPRNEDGRGAGAAMAMERFRALLDAHGARPERWPAGEREAATALSLASADARAALAEAEALDLLLDGLGAPEPSAELVDRVMGAAPVAMPQPRPRRRPGKLSRALGLIWPDVPAWKPATALAASLVLGLAAGSFAPPGAVDLSGYSDDSALIFPDFDAEGGGAAL